LVCRDVGAILVEGGVVALVGAVFVLVLIKLLKIMHIPSIIPV